MQNLKVKYVNYMVFLLETSDKHEPEIRRERLQRNCALSGKAVSVQRIHSHSFNSGETSLHHKAEGSHALFQINSILGFIINSKKGKQYYVESQKKIKMLYFIADSFRFFVS